MADGVRRRELLTFWRRAPPPEEPPDPLRPPGALAEPLFVDACQRCGRCIELCPRQAIAPLDASFGASAGTPAIRPREAPCVVCEGLQCTHACPSGALRPLAVSAIDLGTAAVDPARCLAFQGDPCRACVEACPVPGALLAPDGRPQVDPGRCIGCGVCEHVCPTPIASVRVIPSRTLARGPDASRSR